MHLLYLSDGEDMQGGLQNLFYLWSEVTLSELNLTILFYLHDLTLQTPQHEGQLVGSGGGRNGNNNQV